jgi:DNA-directed RNA polymerase omega subunit
MLFYEIEALIDDSANKYKLAVIAAKRARQLNLGASKTVDVNFKNSSNIGLYELLSGKLKYDEPKG